MSLPLVSVMMPAYNAGSYICAAIKSMKAQTYKDWQLCIVDDGSEDLTANLAQSFANQDGRICVERITHAGCPSARNIALKMAQGDIIARLDADDTHEPERLERQVQFLLDRDDVDIVTCGMSWLRGSLRLQKPAVKGMLPAAYMAGKSNGPCCASLVAWTKVYGQVGEFDPTMLAGSDGDWNFRAILEDMRWGHLDNYWYNQRRHAGQLSQSMRAVQRRVHEHSREKYSQLWKNK